jgi:hypothetical protein
MMKAKIIKSRPTVKVTNELVHSFYLREKLDSRNKRLQVSNYQQALILITSHEFSFFLNKHLLNNLNYIAYCGYCPKVLLDRMLRPHHYKGDFLLPTIYQL